MISPARWPRTLLPMLLSGSFLMGCSLHSERSAPIERPRLALIDSALMRPLPPQAASRIPPGDQPPAVVFPLLYEDAANYKVCRARFNGLVAAVKARDSAQGLQ